MSQLLTAPFNMLQIQEETGITLSGPITFEYATNSVFDEQRHYVTVFMKAEVPEVGS
jgi:hypothetical protein